MPPFDGDRPGTSVLARSEPITLTGPITPRQRPTMPGILSAWIHDPAREFIPELSGPFFTFLERVEALANAQLDNRVKRGCYASIGALAEYKRLRCSHQTIRNYIKQGLDMGLLTQVIGGGIKTNSGWTNLLNTTEKCAFALRNEGRAVWWHPRIEIARPRPQTAGAPGLNRKPETSSTLPEPPGYQGQAQREIQINKNECSAREAREAKPARREPKKSYLPDENGPTRPPRQFVSTPENPTAFIDNLTCSATTRQSLRAGWIGREGDSYVFDREKLSCMAPRALELAYPQIDFQFRSAPAPTPDPEPAAATDVCSKTSSQATLADDPCRGQLLDFLQACDNPARSSLPQATRSSPAPERIESVRLTSAPTAAASTTADVYATAREVLRERGLGPRPRRRARRAYPSEIHGFLGERLAYPVTNESQVTGGRSMAPISTFASSRASPLLVYA